MQECDGRVEASRGWWSSRWDAQMIFYDPDDFADVANGSIDPSAPQPYASLDIDAHLLYVYEFMADGAKPVIHVWAVQ